MPAGQLFINNKDAYTQWGVSMDENALSILMTFSPVKPYIQNKSRLNNGKTVIVNNTKVDERQFTIVFNITAPSESVFYQRLDAFESELKSGIVKIRTSFRPTIEYKCVYVSCTQFTQFVRRIGKVYVRFEEPDPTNRSVTS